MSPSHIIALLILWSGLYLTTNATENKPSVASVMRQHLTQEKIKKQRLENAALLKDVKPTLEEIKKSKDPWGVDLELVKQRGINVRKSLAGGGDDFSSKITLYQKHKTIDRNLQDELQKMTSDIKKAQADLVSKNPVKIYRRPKTKKKIMQLENQISNLKEKLQQNSEKMEVFEKTIVASTGLKPEQVKKLPPYDEWLDNQKKAQTK